MGNYRAAVDTPSCPTGFSRKQPGEKPKEEFARRTRTNALDLHVLDEKKAKRIISNRQSALKSRQKKFNDVQRIEADISESKGWAEAVSNDMRLAEASNARLQDLLYESKQFIALMGQELRHHAAVNLSLLSEYAILSEMLTGREQLNALEQGQEFVSGPPGLSEIPSLTWHDEAFTNQHSALREDSMKSPSPFAIRTCVNPSAMPLPMSLEAFGTGFPEDDWLGPLLAGLSQGRELAENRSEMDGAVGKKDNISSIESMGSLSAALDMYPLEPSKSICDDDQSLAAVFLKSSTQHDQDTSATSLEPLMMANSLSRTSLPWASYMDTSSPLEAGIAPLGFQSPINLVRLCSPDTCLEPQLQNPWPMPTLSH